MQTENDDFFLDPEEVKKKIEDKKKAQATHNRFIDDLKWVLSKPQGRRIFYWLLSLCGIWRGSYVPGSEEARRQSDFNEGQRDIGLALTIALNEADPAVVLQMQSENLAEKLKVKNKEKLNG